MQAVDDAQVLETAIRAARAGGELALSLLDQPGYVRWKGMRDPQVEASHAVQRAILAEIAVDFPDHQVLAEELDARPPPGADPLWIVDPIDGSMNFLQGTPHFAVCVGFRRGDVYRVGVVYDPARDELFQAVLGQGARLNGYPIVVQQISDGHDAFENAIIGTDLPREGERRAQGLHIAQIMATHTLDLTAMGSPALGLCYLAAGRLHAYYHLDLDLWDIAAASVVASEAGAVITNARGSSWLFADRSYLATNGVIHGEMLRHMMAVLDPQLPPGAAAL